jgi:hypothetical protein
MADKEPESAIQKLNREVWLSLRARGGRVFMDGATAETLERSTIELNCRWAGVTWLSGLNLTIGDEQHPPLPSSRRHRPMEGETEQLETGWKLSDCPITVNVDEVDGKAIAESAAKNNGTPEIGLLKYYERVNTPDGVVNDKRPSLAAYVGVGAETFRFIRDRLLATETPEFELGFNVEFPRGSVDRGWVNTKVNWDGKDTLPVTDARFVWPRGGWNSDEDNEDGPPEPEEYEPPREHVELLGAIERLQANMVKLTTPIWIAAAAAFVAAVVLISR